MVHSTLLAEDPALSPDSIQFDLEPAETEGSKLEKNLVFVLLGACKIKDNTREQHLNLCIYSQQCTLTYLARLLHCGNIYFVPKESTGFVNSCFTIEVIMLAN